MNLLLKDCADAPTSVLAPALRTAARLTGAFFTTFLTGFLTTFLTTFLTGFLTTFFTALRTGFFGAAFDEPPNITGDAMEVRIATAPVLTGATKPWHVPMSARRTSLKKFMGREKAERCCGETHRI